jgi:hypothetical protein
MNTPIRHPTYGALPELAREMDAALARGEHVRMGHIGAMRWFVRAYQTAPGARRSLLATLESLEPLDDLSSEARADLAADREVGLRLAVRGLADHPFPPLVPAEHYHAVHRTAEETIGRRITDWLTKTLAQWDETGDEPDWAEVLADLETDGAEYVGPSAWVEFGEKDLPILTLAAHVMIGEVRRQLEATLRALDR